MKKLLLSILAGFAFLPVFATPPQPVVVYDSMLNSNVCHLHPANATFDIPSAIIHLDCNRTDAYTADGTKTRPYKTFDSAISALASTALTAVDLDFAPGTYTASGNVTFASGLAVFMHGHGSTLTLNSGAGTMTTQGRVGMSELLVAGNFVQSTNPNWHNVFQNGGVTGNFTVNGYCDFKTFTLGVAASPASLLTVNSSGTVVVIVSTVYGRIYTSGALLAFGSLIYSSDASNPCVSTGNASATSVMLNGCILTNALAGGCVSLSNSTFASSAFTANAVANNRMICTSGQPIACGSSYTSLSKNDIPIGTASTGTHILTVPDAK